MNFHLSIITRPKDDPTANMCICSPWGVFEVDVENMRGVERGLDWVLHHLAKKRWRITSLFFHVFAFQERLELSLKPGQSLKS